MAAAARRPTAFPEGEHENDGDDHGSGESRGGESEPAAALPGVNAEDDERDRRPSTLTADELLSTEFAARRLSVTTMRAEEDEVE